MNNKIENEIVFARICGNFVRRLLRCLKFAELCLEDWFSGEINYNEIFDNEILCSDDFTIPDMELETLEQVKNLIYQTEPIWKEFHKGIKANPQIEWFELFDQAAKNAFVTYDIMKRALSGDQKCVEYVLSFKANIPVNTAEQLLDHISNFWQLDTYARYNLLKSKHDNIGKHDRTQKWEIDFAIQKANQIVKTRPNINKSQLAHALDKAMEECGITHPQIPAIRDAIDKWQGLGKGNNPPKACVNWTLKKLDKGRPPKEEK